MALEEYRRKRDFRRTPEPHGQVERRQGPRGRFVVQKHAARRLHYDFRLEIDGVLKSWAIPKGPSLAPGEKRLAVPTEDHPMEYGDFEGVIPKGEYGAGTVVLWDRGEWEAEGDPVKGYAAGRLKFRLYGKRLQGRWALVRTGRKADSDADWLLLKSDDEFADPGFTEWDEDSSVVSGRGMAQVAAAPERLWHSDSGVAEERLPAIEDGTPEPLPATLAPQLTQPVEHPPAGDNWLHEIKFDGYRVLLRVDNGRATVFSRSGKDWTVKVPQLAQAAAALPVRTAWLDGELCAVQADGTTSFQALQEALSEDRTEHLVGFLFDLLHLNGRDLRALPLTDRKQALAQLLGAADQTDSPLRFSDHVIGHGEAFFDQACGLNLEGVVSKRADAPYRAGRGRDWRKAKCLLRQEFVIGGYTDPSGGRHGFGALLLGQYDGDRLQFAGRVGTGFSDALLRNLHRRLTALATDDPPFADPVPGSHRGLHWVRPELVAEVRFTEWTRDGILRQPAFLGLREDKPASEVQREVPAAAPQARVSPEEQQAVREEVARRLMKLRLSNPDKVLYPDQGVTKRGLAEYFAAVADWVLPDLVGRPLTLLRCPDGHHGGCFFQKHAGGRLPPGLRTVDIPEKGKDEPYLYIDDLEGLFGLVQMGVLEIHTWGAHADRVEAPDRMVFDLDPAEDLPYARVIEAAFAVRARLDDLGLRAFVRTTGGKGLHVVVPLTRRHDWEQVKGFSHAVAKTLVRREPGRYTVSPSKKARPGKVFVDYLRNGRGATAIASYATRARPGAPVAMPVAWEELTADVPPDAWTVANTPAYLQQRRADPWQDYAGLRQTLTQAMWQRLEG